MKFKLEESKKENSNVVNYNIIRILDNHGTYVGLITINKPAVYNFIEEIKKTNIEVEV
jgi:hypothetical protein